MFARRFRRTVQRNRKLFMKKGCVPNKTGIEIVLAARDARHFVLDHQALRLTLTHLERHSDLIHRHKFVFLFGRDSPGFLHNAAVRLGTSPL